MKNNKLKIIFGFIFISVFCFIFAAQNVFAWTPKWDAVQNYSAGNTGNVVYTTMGAVINIVSIAGAGIAIIMLIWLAIKYVNTYHPADKAEIKKQLPVYITGAVILFGASSILKIIQIFIEGNINNI